MQAQPVGPSQIISGRADYNRQHLPGAQHIDMVDDLSDPHGQLPYTAINPSLFAELMNRLDVGPQDHVILYGQSGVSTITRAWFIFHLNGQPVSILDGGLKGWQAAGYETVQGPSPETRQAQKNAPEPASALTPRSDLIVDRTAVHKALESGNVQLINALSPEQFAGTGGAHYGRPGRIPHSLSLPARAMVDPLTSCFWDLAVLRDKVRAAGIVIDKPAIHYCGGGIAATTSAFVMHMLGATDWAIYDNSLLDWSNQADCPMVCR